MKKIKIAFIKFGGLAAGGTEKALQTIAANLSKEKFEVDYFYCDSAPYIGSDYKHDDTDPSRKAYMESKNINLIKFDLKYKNITVPTHDWVDTNFWDLFDEEKYDLIQTARAGHSEYPFTKINKIPQVDLITLPGMAERKANVFKTVHISNFQANSWIQAGGDPSKIEIIPLFDELDEITKTNLRQDYNLENKFIFGMHQRNNDGIYSPVPLMAYKEIETDNTAFLLMGGSEKYREQAEKIKLRNFIHLPHSGDKKHINTFLQTLNVFTHGRSDGETFSLAIAEAMNHGLPIVSHVAPAMGHAETIGEAGLVANSIELYVSEMSKLMKEEEYYTSKSKSAKERFDKFLSLESNIKRWENLYESCMANKQKDVLSNEEFWNDMWE